MKEINLQQLEELNGGGLGHDLGHMLGTGFGNSLNSTYKYYTDKVTRTRWGISYETYCKMIGKH